MKHLQLGLLFAVSAFIALGQGLDSAMLLKPLSDSWPTYSGDYSGKRYSSLAQIDRSNVKNLTLAWGGRVAAGAGGGRGGGQTIVGGEGTGALAGGGVPPSKLRYSK